MSLPRQPIPDWLADRVGTWLVEPFRTDPSFRAGFIRGVLVALVSALVIGQLTNEILFRWNQILQFFEPSAAPPSPEEGPRPVDVFVSCLVALFLLLVYGGLVIWVFLQLTRPSGV